MRSTPEVDRMREVIEMHDFGVALYRQWMRRENPGADEAQIERLTRAWLAAPTPGDRDRPKHEAR